MTLFAKFSDFADSLANAGVSPEGTHVLLESNQFNSLRERIQDEAPDAASTNHHSFKYGGVWFIDSGCFVYAWKH